MKEFESKNLLIGGRTGSGKSTFLHSLIARLIGGNGAEQVGLILVDTKRVEFSLYRNDPHLVTDIVYDNEAAKRAIESVLMRAEEYPSAGDPSQVYVIVDEFSDLMAYDPVFFEDAFARLAKESGLNGIYVVLASSKTIPGVFTPILLNSPFERVAFRVSGEEDSALILGTKGAETLVGQGSCLVRSASDGEIVSRSIRNIA